MPFYEYKCKKCGFKLEELQGIDEDPLTLCPKCKINTLKRILSVNSCNVNYLNAKEYAAKEIKPEAKRIAEKIKNGDEELAANIFGSGE